jgi:putative toxin-antitoxin system antitoxin component (TIGR02293 family)
VADVPITESKEANVEWLETASALGGTAVLGDEVVSGPAFIQRIEEGFPRETLSHLKRFGDLSDADMSQVIPRRTLTSIQASERLTADQSDRIARTAGIVALAQRVFGDRSTAGHWLRTPNPALRNEVPLRLLRTGSGAQLVEAVLVRIEYGVYE